MIEILQHLVYTIFKSKAVITTYASALKLFNNRYSLLFNKSNGSRKMMHSTTYITSSQMTIAKKDQDYN